MFFCFLSLLPLERFQKSQKLKKCIHCGVIRQYHISTAPNKVKSYLALFLLAGEQIQNSVGSFLE